MASSATASAAKTTPLSFMEALHPLVLIYRPAETSSSSTTYKQPRLIIIGSWTGAQDVHIAKYIFRYQALYPAAQILLLKSTMTQVLNPSQIGSIMQHAVPVIRAAFPQGTSPSSPELLIHILSNGGSSSLANLYREYGAAASAGEATHLPPHVTIFDSCPGVYTIRSTVAFVSVGLPRFVQLLAAPFLYASATVWSALIVVGLLPDGLREWGEAHNNIALNGSELRRAYISSPRDAIVGYQDVEAHAADAMAKGFSVVMEKYEDSGHVAHMRQDQDRYWNIVRMIMDGSNSLTG
ncbi:hypothetical protein B0I35DRAFT_75527 [Stachybotrys elegans]|uniref:Indole-diterpene biosynthesis protein PaxU n=1 Tax=Stachybotrys elegans TaxID=80388 RepID=A0A8K0SIH6_9HYPO|nr:hypothetical protein B0I35DRAFT_75527 [Stachybotrys elegans]